MVIVCLMGVVAAADLGNVSNTEDSNLISGDAQALSAENKLEVSSEDSISETILVNSHDDDLNSYSNTAVLKSCYEDNCGQVQSSNNSVGSDKISVSSGKNVLSASSSKDSSLAATAKVPTNLTVSDTHYGKSATSFKVTLKDEKGNAVKNQNISLTVKAHTYYAVTNSAGVALIKTAALPIGAYNVAITYKGNSNYRNSYLATKVNVLSSVIGNDIKKYYGYVSVYKVQYWKDNDPLANTNVSLTIHGVTYTKTTDANGRTTLNVNLAPGTYSIDTVNPYSLEKASNTVISKKDGSVLEHAADTYLTPNTQSKYTVLLKSNHNTILTGKTVIFTFNNKQVVTKTDNEGKARFSIPNLSIGTYKISYKFEGDHLFGPGSGSGTLHVRNPTTKLQSSALKMEYGDGSKFAVTVKDKNDKPLTNLDVKFTLNGKTYAQKTNSKGVAYLTVGNLKPGTYTVKFQAGVYGNDNYNSGSNTITISKQTVLISAGNLFMNYKDGSSYNVTVKTKDGKPLKGATVKFTIHTVTYPKVTDANGKIIYNIGLVIGYYPTVAVVDDDYHTSATLKEYVIVNGTKFVAQNTYVASGSSATYSVQLLNYNDKPIQNANVVFKMDGKTYNAKTDSNGNAKVNLGVLSKGVHSITYTHEKYSGTSKIEVLDTVTISQLIAASKTVKSYIEANYKLPTSVKVGTNTLTTAQYLYLASKAIINLKAGKTTAIPIIKVGNPKNPIVAYSLGNLYNYLAVANSVVKTADSTGVMPNSVPSSLGTIGYEGVVYAFARVVAFYGNEKVMPSYVAIKALYGDSSAVSGIPNTISNLAPYLAASTNCQVNNAQIKALANKLTSGLTSDAAKARAIYNYVRDYISYSFYYDTKYGAAGTLSAKTGNCVDQAHLSVALYRAAKLPARYAHGTCTFSSGSTYGHVWAQVLVGNYWIVSDTTSNRNSLGTIANWNTNSYSLHGYYSSLSF
ncbi:Ig-like domain-containing protein [Methanobrevibacter sp. YE315]|uniref:transglutaminase domain-containing protein n=1 Tax=Methanobrevibacter sp. YE315 TaxID=1609968 RepID=UPI0012DDA03A|nr:Ig-like domain-containing protein [Methanobrevibacter sp. YE315]